MSSRRIGVLALQGCVDPHQKHIEALGCEFVRVKTADDLKNLNALILPGGESTTLLKLIETYELESALKQTFREVPVWGICAGAILAARDVARSENITSPQKAFGLIDVLIVRNAYGRQLDSFNANIHDYPVSFIRAPRISRVGRGVEVLARSGADPVWVEQGQVMLTTFHPELTPHYPSPMHRRLASKLDAQTL